MQIELIWLRKGASDWLDFVNTVMHLRISNNAGISSVTEELCPVELVTKCR
jgi:hypothetical protein